MNTNDLNAALYEKMAAEQDQYRDWLKSQPPEEILHHAYEYSVREDIVMAMEELELTDAQAAQQAPRKLFLRLSRKDMDQAQAMLALEAGEIPVYMHIPEEKMTLLCPRTAWCNGSESCVSRLREALGSENVVMKG